MAAPVGPKKVHRYTLEFLKTGNLRLDESLPTRTDQIWVGDLTYLRLGKRWRYLATVMDLFSRRIVGWTLARNRTTDVTLRALKRAITARSPSPDCCSIPTVASSTRPTATRTISRPTASCPA